MKTIGRILIVLAITAALCAGTYFLFTGIQSQTNLSFVNGEGQTLDSGTSFQHGPGMGLGNGTGLQKNRSSEGESGSLQSDQWIDVLKNVGIFAAVILVISGVRTTARLIKNKRKIPIPVD